MRAVVLAAEIVFVSFWLWLAAALTWAVWLMEKIYKKHRPYMLKYFGEDWSLKTHPETRDVFKGITSRDMAYYMCETWSGKLMSFLDSFYMFFLAPDCFFLMFDAIRHHQTGYIIWWGVWTGVFTAMWFGPGGRWRRWKKKAKEQVAKVGDKLVVIPVRTQE